ncbi:DUF4054 domain-containing protein [Inquilinus sp.]|uniref:DUF4054 domain-containing protein n=1 Tax=Inquilinus sp. TaxID=1932117 RepID=UPI0031E1CDBE
MAWNPPTPADLKARFPAFAAVSDSVVQGALDEAALQVDETWVSEADFRLGRLLLAAHILTLDGLGTGAEAEAAAAGAMGFKRMKSGRLELERFSAADAGGDGSVLGSTSYGRRFLELLRRNFPAVAVV